MFCTGGVRSQAPIRATATRATDSSATDSRPGLRFLMARRVAHHPEQRPYRPRGSSMLLTS
jgi:hypothetical protein